MIDNGMTRKWFVAASALWLAASAWGCTDSATPSATTALPTVCDEDARRCDGDVVFECGAQGTAWVFIESCETSCAAGACADAVCITGDRRCAGASLEQCDRSGAGWAFVHECTAGCTEGECLVAETGTSCTEGDRRCDADAVLICDEKGEAWRFEEDCAAGCAAGACVETTCTTGERRCAGTDLEECDSRGTTWSLIRACASGCTEGACDADDPEIDCATGDRRCNGDRVELCDQGGDWALEERCTTLCSAGLCLLPVCDAGDRRCAGPSIEQCGLRGLQWDLVHTCEAGCDEGVCLIGGDNGCRSGELRCNGDNIELCIESVWQQTGQCNTACEGGQCLPAACQPETRRCVEDELEICDERGLGWEFRRICEAGCDRGECLERICEPFSRRCNGLIPQQCNPRGNAWVDGTPCQNSCLDAVCDRIPEGGCRPNSSRCNGQTRELCNDFFAWEVAEQCTNACLRGDCVACVPGAQRCDEDVVERCAIDGRAWDEVEVCEVGCLGARCTECEPAARRCNGDVVETCANDGQGWAPATVCLTSCQEGVCTPCRPDDYRCAGNTVEQCSEDGQAFTLTEECGGRCDQGVCVDEAICVPGTRRCAGQNAEVCNPQGSGWLVVESCMDTCDAGDCEGAACLPFSLAATPTALPADGVSSALIVSNLILDVEGTPVPDGSLFTITVEGATLLAADGDPNAEGVQVRSLNGRIDFAVQAPGEEGQAQVAAAHSVATRCAGQALLPFEAPEDTQTVALDFTSEDANDTEETTALWDTILGRVDPFPSDFGGGEDGDLNVNRTYNINRDSQPNRLFPDAVNFIVTGLGENSTTVRGGVGGVDIGDEVLLINLQGTPESNQNVANYELLEIARIDYGANTVYFTTALRRLYGTGEDNSDLTGQKIMLQRVPRYRSLRVNSTLTADGWDGEKGGVFFIKVLGSAEVQSNIDMNGKGYRPLSGEGAAESHTGPAIANATQPNGGGGVCHRSHYRRINGACYRSWRYEYYQGVGGTYATVGESNYDMPAGEVYGEPSLARWYLGTGGTSRISERQYCGCSCQWGPFDVSNDGSAGGGVVVLWASGITVRGTIRARAYQGGTFRGAAGTIFLRARSMNVGGGLVQAIGGDAGGAGRIRLDFFGLAGTTNPEYHPGFTGDTGAVTTAIDNTNGPVETVTILQAVTDERGGNITYEATNDGGANWYEVTPGETYTFPQSASDLRLRVSFANENLDPLTLNGLAVEYTVGE